MNLDYQKIFNLAIIAHVDHGKTTLIDQILKQNGVFRENQDVAECVLDSNIFERARGITISAKCTTIFRKSFKNPQQKIKFNIIDTPGHADFGGEVERILSMADGVLLLVDSCEGVMPQTKFVLSKALVHHLKVIVIINKIDKPNRNVERVVNEITELFLALEVDDDQLNFPTLYAAGRDGWCTKNLEDKRENLDPLFEVIEDYFKPSFSESDTAEIETENFAMLPTLLDYDSFLGRVLVGKILSGVAKINTPIKAMDLQGKLIEQGKLTKLYSFQEIHRVPIEEAYRGDIVAIAGLAKASVADTICSAESEMKPLETYPIDPPTMSINLSLNTSPYAGKDGSKVTSRNIYDRLMAEAQRNVAIKVERNANDDSFIVSGRGELQLGILIENLRNEDFELSVARPKVIYQIDEQTGKKMEPVEQVVIDVDDEFSGIVIDQLNQRKGSMVDMVQTGSDKTRLTYHVPTRCLIGYQGEFLTSTRGTGVMNKIFHSYIPFQGERPRRKNGVLVSNGKGKVVAYAIFNLQDRGTMLVEPQDETYEGMIVGIHNRDNDLDVNILKGKQLTNMRASGSDEAVVLIAKKQMTLEEMIAFLEDDELLEVTPKVLRLRKKYLNPNDRKKFGKKIED